MKYDWDERLPQDIQDKFRQWLTDVTKLDKLTIPRSFGVDKEVVLHVSVDASVIGYVAVAYFVHGDKVVVWVSRVSPEKIGGMDVGGSVPRLELHSAVVGVEMMTQIKEDMDVRISQS